jgi:hypothetical protein
LEPESLKRAVDSLGEVADNLRERPVTEHRAFAGSQAFAIDDDVAQFAESDDPKRRR